MAEKHNVTGRQDLSIDKQMTEIKKLLRLKGGSPLDPKYLKRVLQAVIEGKSISLNEKVIELECIEGTEDLFIDSVDSKALHLLSHQIFPGGIKDEFTGWEDLEKNRINTEETSVQVFKVMEDTYLSDLFESPGVNLDKICFTRDQIEGFCIKYPQWLRQNNRPTFFLYKIDDQYFVATVFVWNVGLRLKVYKLGHELAFEHRDEPYVVLPKLDE